MVDELPWKRIRTSDSDAGPGKTWQHYDFIEVGTSDFRTRTQYIHQSDTTCPLGLALHTWDPEKAVGLAVEP
eukprot:585774-Alexandrium_andersonii.AAC.1